MRLTQEHCFDARTILKDQCPLTQHKNIVWHWHNLKYTVQRRWFMIWYVFTILYRTYSNCKWRIPYRSVVLFSQSIAHWLQMVRNVLDPLLLRFTAVLRHHCTLFKFYIIQVMTKNNATRLSGKVVHHLALLEISCTINRISSAKRKLWSITRLSFARPVPFCLPLFLSVSTRACTRPSCARCVRVDVEATVLSSWKNVRSRATICASTMQRCRQIMYYVSILCKSGAKPRIECYVKLCECLALSYASVIPSRLNSCMHASQDYIDDKDLSIRLRNLFQVCSLPHLYYFVLLKIIYRMFWDTSNQKIYDDNAPLRGKRRVPLLTMRSFFCSQTWRK